MKVATLILSGGKSSRMGRDKGSLVKEKKLWVEILCDEVQSFGDVFLSVGNHNSHFYESVNQVVLIKDQPFRNLAGPFVGLLSAKQKLQSYDKVLVIPCDMINLKAGLLKGLLDGSRSSAFKLKGNIESLPFCLNKLDLTNLKELDNRSVYSVLKTLDLNLVETVEETAFRNFNSEEDLAG